MSEDNESKNELVENKEVQSSSTAKSILYYFLLTVASLYFTSSLFEESDSRTAFFIGYVYYHVSVQIISTISNFFFNESE